MIGGTPLRPALAAHLAEIDRASRRAIRAERRALLRRMAGAIYRTDVGGKLFGDLPEWAQRPYIKRAEAALAVVSRAWGRS